MNTYTKQLLTLALTASSAVYAQEKNNFTGRVLDAFNQPVARAIISYSEYDIDTETDESGNFSIEFIKNQELSIYSEGYETYVFQIENPSFAVYKLTPTEDLATIFINKERKSTHRSSKDAHNTHTMTSKELLKAACCNLAESFETNPSIDVNFSDAVSGNKQIRMLGLTSPYILIAEENIPAVRGASQAYGLSFIPGTWVESIQVTKGAGSVTNGFESISGQINYELLKPSNDDPFFLNLYGSTDSRYELNAHINERFSPKWSTSLFTHGNMRVKKNDMNKDGFLDNPLGSQVNIMNRWQYTNNDKGFVGFLSVRGLIDEKQTGDLSYDPKNPAGLWGAEINTKKFDTSSKIRYVFPDMPFQSIGWQNSFSFHQQNSYFGNNLFDITHRSVYSNLVFQSIIQNTKNKFSTGLSFMYDDYSENLFNYSNHNFDRTDRSIGGYFEYTYDNLDNFSLIAGLRADYSNQLDFFVTPRLHARYNPWKDATIKASAGRGKRIANIIAENQHLLASSRTVHIHSSENKPYGLNPEIAWNYGASFSQKFYISDKEGQLVIDYYKTNFINQVVVDLDQSARNIHFYNLNGKSYANSLQIEWNQNIIPHLNLRTAYKHFEVKTNYKTGLMQKPLQAQQRFFANLEYQTHETETGGSWKFDITYNRTGRQRLPYTGDNSVANQLGAYADAFTTINAQITKIFNNRFEVYLGVENLTDTHQHRVLLGADNPFGNEFDSSIVYKPIFGRMFYTGLRFRVK